MEDQSMDPDNKPSDERNGSFLDSMWCCKVCDGEIPDGEVSMNSFARGSTRATVFSVKNNHMAAIRITAPTKVRNRVRVMDIHPTTAKHLGEWLIKATGADHE